MKNKKFNKDLLKEEVNRFKLISEFDFYEVPTEDDLKKKKEAAALLLGTVSEEEEEIGAEEEPKDTEGLGGEEEGVSGEEELEGSSDDSEGGEDDFDFGGEEPGEDAEGGFGDDPMDEPMDEPAGDEVELDVTELVTGAEEAKAAAEAANATATSANKKIDQLMGMMNNLEKQSNSMSQISNKIDSLENELEKRAPTPNEKLEMRSLDSAPFNMRLGDFWEKQEGQYDVMSKNEPEEYVLDKKTIDDDYSDVEVADSLGTSEEYDEENF